MYRFMNHNCHLPLFYYQDKDLTLFVMSDQKTNTDPSHSDSIEQNIEDGVGNIQQGNTHLRQAREHQVGYEGSTFI